MVEMSGDDSFRFATPTDFRAALDGAGTVTGAGSLDGRFNHLVRGALRRAARERL
jgi:hypothetical protein